MRFPADRRVRGIAVWVALVTVAGVSGCQGGIFEPWYAEPQNDGGTVADVTDTSDSVPDGDGETGPEPPCDARRACDGTGCRLDVEPTPTVDQRFEFVWMESSHPERPPPSCSRDEPIFPVAFRQVSENGSHCRSGRRPTGCDGSRPPSRCIPERTISPGSAAIALRWRCATGCDDFAVTRRYHNRTP